MENNTITSAIRHLATSQNENLIAAALFEESVSIWNIISGEMIAEYDTILDFGGERFALSFQQEVCLAAAYHVHGLACYRMLDGRVLWQRKDLKKIQQIVVAGHTKQAFCCFEKGPCQVIDIVTGKTVERIRGLKNIWIDGVSGFQVRLSSKLFVVDSNGEVAFEITRGSFAVLDSAFGGGHLVISESGADVRMFDVSSGEELVSHDQPPGHHVLRLCYSHQESLFYAVQWNYQHGGPYILLRLSSSGVEQVCNLGHSAEVIFCSQGKYVITSEGLIFECQTGQMVRELSFPKL